MTTEAPPESIAEAKKLVGQSFFQKVVKPVTDTLFEKLGTKGVGVVSALLVVGGGGAAVQATGVEIPVVSGAVQGVTNTVTGNTDRIERVEADVATIKSDVAEIKGYVLASSRPAATGQTLRQSIGGQRIDTLAIGSTGSRMSIGAASGLTESIKISSATGTIYCDELIIDGLVAPRLLVSTSTAYALTLTNNIADGNSFSYVPDGTVSDVSVGSLRGAAVVNPIVGDEYDRIIIESSATSTVKAIKLTNIDAFGAPVDISGVTCGKIEIKNSTIGSGTGINSADFVLASSVKGNVITSTGNVERPVNVR